MLKIDIKIRPSVFLLAGWCGFLLATAMIIGLLPIHVLLKVGLSTAVFVYGGYILYSRILLRGKEAILTAQLRQDGWLLLGKNLANYADLLGESVVTRWIAVLRFRVKQTRKKMTVIISKDMLTYDAYRNLIVHAKGQRSSE